MSCIVTSPSTPLSTSSRPAGRKRDQGGVPDSFRRLFLLRLFLFRELRKFSQLNARIVCRILLQPAKVPRAIDDENPVLRRLNHRNDVVIDADVSLVPGRNQIGA